MSDTKRIDEGEVPTVVEVRGATQPLAPPGRPLAGAPQHLRLGEVIGRGGMGQVFRGEQVALGRSIAFKQLLDTKSETQRERFVREAQITAQLDHPNIVPIHSLEASASGGVVGYAMKLVEGKTLRGLLAEAIAATERAEPVPEGCTRVALLDYFLKVCDAVAFAHARGVLHRDLKPPNIMVGRFGEVYVMDWGVARTLARDDAAPHDDARDDGGGGDLTKVGQVVGTPSYMSPEQAAARNAELDARSDQYALGLILFEIVTLRRARETSGSDADLMARATSGKKVRFEHLSSRERVPVELRAIVEKATSFEPDERYPSVVALADDLRRYLRGESVEARPDTALESIVRWVSRHGRATLAVLLGVVAISVMAISWTSYRKAVSELRARQRGDAITALYGDVASQARFLDDQFQRMEEALEGLRTAAEWTLTTPAEPGGEAPAIFFETDFADPGRRPADFTDQTRYRWPVSASAPVVAVAPGTDRRAIMPKLRRLATLRDHMADMFVAAGGESPRTLSPEAKRRYLLDRRSPIDYAYVSLPEGVQFMLPGMASMPPDYDVRTAGFYTMSANKPGRRWGAPYVDGTTDAEGDDLVLPCTQALWSRKGEFLGIAGVEITVTKLVTSGLVLPRRPMVRASLVTGEGKKVIDSFDANKRFKTNGRDEGLSLSDFDIPEIAAEMRRGAQGAREITLGGKNELVVFVRLDVLKWFYVVEIDASTLLVR